MGFEHLFKRCFPGVVCILLCLAAYFQSKGMSALMTGEISGPASRTAPSKRSPLNASLPRQTAKSARDILARNAFDSTTGPLDGSASIAQAPTPVAPSTPVDDRAAPPCAAGSVVLIAEGDEPAWSFAVIRASGGAKLRRVGDEVDGKHVGAILWDRVVLTSGSDKCSLRVGASGTSAGSRPALAQSETKPSPEPDRKSKEGDTAEASPPIAGIKKVGDNKYVFERATVEKLNFPKEFTRNARVVAGKGIRLTRSAKGGLLGQLGLTANDIIKSLNGFDLTDPDKAIEAYSRVKTSKSIQIQVDRAGSPLTVDISIQ